MLAFHYDEVDSTNTRAAARAIDHPRLPVLVTAVTQSAGRGRAGRAWRSPAGGAWFSLAWPCPKDARDTAAAPLVVGLALFDAIGDRLGPRLRDRLRIKWPNDVLLADRKVAGILCERTVTPGTGGEAGGHTLIAGVGVNANVDPASLGDTLRVTATSLQLATGRPIDVRGFIDAVVERMIDRLKALVTRGLTQADVAAVNQRLAWRGERVGVDAATGGGNSVCGELLGVDDAGRLLLLIDGRARAFDAGDACRTGRASGTVGAVGTG
jgi:BirA family biotin operon repressor/biotin-[acetyl-CoA-carboxylase] ligase